MINRRDFLKGAAITAGATAANLVDLNAYAPQASNRVLVVINLYGGNDGLNTVIPLKQYDRYKQLRPRLAVDKESILALSSDPDFGFHPSMSALMSLYKSNRIAVIAGVGVPESAAGLFDHQAGQYQFQSCDLSYSFTNRPPSGWLGRHLDDVKVGLISPGIDMGGGRLLMTGDRRAPISITTLEEFQLKISFDESARKSAYLGIQNAKRQIPVAEVNRQLRIESLQQSGIIQKRIAGYTSAAPYPGSYLARQLRQCAQIIWGDLGVRALGVGYGDFDTHFGQLGVHDDNLQELSEAVAAFHSDLSGHGLADRVLILTISEFGRRAYENNDVGTDHGFGSVAMAIGNSVKPGIHGGYPDLSDSKLVLDGNLDVHTDFRSVYATVISRFLDADPAPAVRGKFPLLGFL